MSLQEDLRSCASLFAFFESSLNSATRTTLSIENALTNLAFLRVRIERLNSTVQGELNTIGLLNKNIDNAIKKGKELLQNLSSSMTGQEELIDLVGDSESIHNTTDQLDLRNLFASLNLNFEDEPLDTQPTPAPRTMPPNAQSNTFTAQSHFNRDVPLSSTNANTHDFSRTQFNPISTVRNDQRTFSSVHVANNFDEAESLPYQNFNQKGAIYTPQRRDIKLYKWKVKFSGEDSKYDAIDFIQKVNALAQSRGVTDSELFDSAIDLFSGQALKWYYAQRSQTKTWAELSEKLVSDFIEVNYYDNLLDTIRQRRHQMSRL